MLSLHCPGSLREPNPGGRRDTEKTTDENASRHPKIATGNNEIVRSVSDHEKGMLCPKLSKVSEFSLEGGGGYSGEVGDERPRLARALALAASAPTKRKEECRKNSRVKRQASQVDDSGEESPSDQPSKKKRLRTKNQDPSKASLQPFACPSFRHNKIQNAECGSWRNVKLSMVKQHCVEKHVKPLRCGRCRIFKAGTSDEITKHLQEGDCQKSYAPDPSEKYATGKVSEIEKAKTWERIYEVLHPQVIPDPFYNEQAQGNITNHRIDNPSLDAIPAEYENTITSSQGFDWPGEDLYLLQGIAFPPLEYWSMERE